MIGSRVPKNKLEEMIEVDIPGHRRLQLHHLVLDYNGTLAEDGLLIPGVEPTLQSLSKDIGIHVLTADTFGNVRSRLANVPCNLVILAPTQQDIGKRDYVRELGAQNAASIGNGRNDRLMLKESALGIAVILQEGCAAETLAAADAVCTDIVSALKLLSNPLRLIATLRS